MDKRKLALLDISEEFFRGVMQMPDDVRVVSGEWDNNRQIMTVCLEGGDYPEHDPGGYIPHVKPIITVNRNSDGFVQSITWDWNP